MSIFKLPTLGNISSRFEGVRDRLGRSSRLARKHQKQRRLLLDPLEERQLLSVSPADYTDILVNETVSEDQITLTSTNQYGTAGWDTAESMAMDDDGDFVVTWTRYDPVYDESGQSVIDPITGEIMRDANVYARYFTDEVQRVTIPDELVVDNDDGSYGAFYVKYGGNEVQKLTVSATTEPYYSDSGSGYPSYGYQENIAGEITFGFDVNGNGVIAAEETVTVIYDETDLMAETANTLQTALQGLGGALADVTIEPISPTEFEIHFGDSSDGEDQPLLTVESTNFSDGFLPAVELEALREPVVLGPIYVSPDDPSLTATSIESAFLLTTTEFDIGPYEFPPSDYVNEYNNSLGPYAEPETVRESIPGVSVDLVYETVVDPVTGESVLQASTTEFAITFDGALGGEEGAAGKIDHPELEFISAVDETGAAVDIATLGTVETLKETSAEFRVNPEEEELIFTSYPDKYDQSDAVVAMDADGDFIIVWESESAEAGDDTDVYARLFTPVGLNAPDEVVYVEGIMAKTDAFLVNTAETTGMQGDPSVGMDSQGNFTIAWGGGGQDLSYYNNVYAKSYNRDGDALTSEYRINADTTAINFNPVVSVSDDGYILITWGLTNDESYILNLSIASSVQATIVDSSGNTLIDQFNAPGGVRQKAAWDKNGNFIITWDEAGADDDNTSTADSNGVHAAMWNLSYGSATDDYSTSVLISEFAVNSASFDVSRTATWPYWQASPTAAVDADGDLTITYEGFGADVSDDVYIGYEFYEEASADPANADLLAFFNNGFILNNAGRNFDIDLAIELELIAAANLGATDEQLGRIRAILDEKATLLRGEANGILYTQIDAAADGDTILYSDNVANATRDGSDQRWLMLIDSRSTGGSFVVRLYNPYVAGYEDVTISPVYVDSVLQVSQTEDAIEDALEGAMRTGENWPEDLYEGSVAVRTVSNTEILNREVEIEDGSKPWAYTNYYSLTTLQNTVVYEITFQGEVHDTGLSMYVYSESLSPDENDYVSVSLYQDGDAGTIQSLSTLEDTMGNALGADGTYASGFNMARSFSVDQADGEVDEDAGSTNLTSATLQPETANAVAVDDDGAYVVVWTAYDSSVGSDRVYMRMFDADGTPADLPIVDSSGNATGTSVDAAPVMLVTADSAFADDRQRYASVAMDPDGDFVITWSGKGADSSSTSGHDVYYQRFDEGGGKIGSETLVNLEADGDQWISSVGMDAIGNFVIVWTGEGFLSDSSALYKYDSNKYLVQSDDAGPIVTDMYWGVDRIFQGGVIEADDGEVTEVTVVFNEELSVAGGEDGLYSVVNPDNQSLVCNGVEIAGGISSVEFGLNPLTGKWEAVVEFDGNGVHYGTPGLEQGTYTLTVRDMVADNSASIDDSESSIVPGEFLDGDRDGVPGTQSYLAGVGGYEQEFSIASSAQNGPEFRINEDDTVEYVQQISEAGGLGQALEETNQAVAVDNDGDFAVVWTTYGLDDASDASGGGVYLRLYDRDNNAVTGEIQVNETTEGDQSNASIAMDTDGDFVVVWQSENADGTYDIYARLFDSTGNALTSEFCVNSTTNDNQVNPSVAMDDRGGFVVTWATSGQDFSYFNDVYAQRYDRFGVAQGSEFMVNTNNLAGTSLTPGAFEINPVVAVSGTTGDFVIAWEVVVSQTNGVATNTVIAGRLYDSNGAAQTEEIQLDSGTGTGGSPTHRVARNPQLAMNDQGGFFLVWESYNGTDYDVHYREFNSSGGTVATGQANMSQFAGQQVNPSVAVDADGDFSIVWKGAGATADPLNPSDPDLQVDEDDSGVFKIDYNAANQTVGTQTRVNHTEYGDQYMATIAMEPDGDSIVVWSGVGVGDTHGIFARRYNEETDTAGPTVSDWADQYSNSLDNSHVFDEEDGATNYMVLTFDEDMLQTGDDSVTNPENYALLLDGIEFEGAIVSVEYGLNMASQLAGTIDTRIGEVYGFDPDPTNKYEAIITFDSDLTTAGLQGLEDGTYTLQALAAVPGVHSGLRDAAGNVLYLTGLQTSGDDFSATFIVNSDGDDDLEDPEPPELTEAEVDAVDLDAILVNQVTSDYQYTTAAQSVATDNDGDFVVSWTRYDSVDDDGNPTDANIYARYYTDEVQRITLPDALSSDTDNSSNTLGEFALEYNAAEIQQLSITAGIEPFTSDDTADDEVGGIEGSFILGFDLTGDGTIGDDPSVQETVTVRNFVESEMEENAASIQTALRSLGGELEGVVVQAVDPRTYQITFADQTAGLGISEITVESFQFSQAYLPAVSISTLREGLRFENIAVSEDDPWGTAAAIEAAIAGVSESYSSIAPITFPSSEDAAENSATGTASSYESPWWSESSSLEVEVTPVIGADGMYSLTEFDITFVGNSGKQDHPQLVVTDARDDQGNVVTVPADAVETRKEPSNEFRVNPEEEDGEELNQTYAVVAMDADGDFVIAWQSEVANTDNYGSVTDVYACRFSPFGIVDDSVEVAGEVLDIFGESSGVRAIINPEAEDVQRLIFGADDSNATLTGSFCLQLGDAITEPITMNSSDLSATADDIEAKLADAGIEGVTVVRVATTTAGRYRLDVRFSGESAGVDQPLLEYVADTTPLAATVTIQDMNVDLYTIAVNQDTANPQFEPSVSMDDDGNFVVAWANGGQLLSYFNHVSVQRFDSDGQRVGNEFQVNTETTSIQYSPYVELSDSGNFLVTWSTTSDSDYQSGNTLYRTGYDNDGADFSRSFSISVTDRTDEPVSDDSPSSSILENGHTDAESAVAIAADADGQYVVVWTATDPTQNSLEKVYYRLYDADGSPADLPIVDSETGEALLDATGNAIVVEDAYPILPVTPSSSVSGFEDFAAATQGNATVAMDEDGDFVITWTNYVDGDADIYARQFDSMGELAGVTEIGNYVFQDGSGWGVYSRLFNRADSTLYVTSETDVEIPDTGSATATLNVSNNAVIADLNVQIELSHDAPGDLTVELISPDGTVVELFSNVPNAYSNGTLATGSNFSGTTLDDEAAIVITNADSGAVPPFADTYQPTGNLAAFDGENVNGQWQLRITDSNGNDRSGLLEQWTLIVEQTPATEDEFRVNTTAVGNQSYPSVAMDHQGEFIVTWSGFGNQTEHEDLSGSGVFLQRYEATGERIGNESRVNMSTEGDQKYSSVASDGVGNYFIAFTGVARDSNGASMLGMTDVFVQTSSSSLVLVDNDPPIVTQVQLDDGTRLLEGDVIAASTGSLVVVLSESMSTTGMTSVENASNWSLKRNGNELADAIESVEFEWNELTRKYEATVNFVDDVLPLTEGEYQLMLSPVVSDGANALDGDRDGIAGSDPTTTTQQGYQFDFIVSDSSDGATVGAESRVNVETEYIDQFSTPSGTGTALETTSTTLAVDHDGDYVVVWTRFGSDDPTDSTGAGVYMRLYDREDAPLTDEILVNTITTGNQQNPSVAMDTDGDLVVVWQSENSSLDGSYDVYARRFSSVGEALDSTEFLVNTETTLNQVNPSVAMDNYGNFVVVWATASEDFAFSTDIQGQLYNRRGEAQGQEFQVNDESLAGISPPADGNFQINPSVAMSGATGNFVVTWEVVTAQQNGIVTDTVIAARQFAADGSAIASEFQADTGVGTGGAEVERVARNAQVTVADDDSFIIVWESYTGVDYDVFFQTFASTGAALTSGQANMAQFTGQQVNPSVAVDVDGNFGIVFNGAGAEANALYPNDPTLYADADDEGVWVRSYDSTSTAVSVESRVNVTSAGIQQFPTIAMEPDGDYVVAWSGQGVGDHSGIFVRRYNESVDLVGPQVTELRLTDGTIVDDEEAVPRPTELVVVFDEDMLNSGEDAVTNIENWILRRDGVEMPDSTVSSITYSLNPETNKYEAVFHFNGYLPAGDYTLTAVAPVPDVPETDDVEGNSGLRDAAGNPLQATGSLPSGTDSTLAFRINTDLGPGSGGTGDVLPANFSVTRSDGDSATPKVDNAQLFSATSGSVATDADGDHIVVLKATEDSGTDRLYYRRFDAAGNPTSDLISVLDGDANASDFEGDIQEDAAVAVDADGDFIITWTNTRDGNADIFARRFSADGQALGDAFQVNDTQISAQSPSPGVASTNPSVAMAPNGNFAVVWDQITAQTNGVITDSQIVAKYFDSQGSELVSEFRVDDGSGTGGGDLYRTARNPQVGLDENGNMTVVWEAYGADDTGVDSSYGVFFQQFEVLIVEDIDLTVSSTVTITAGTSGQVNQADFAGEQVNPGVGVDADGDFTIVWNGAGGESDPLDPTNSDLFVNLDTEGVWLRNYDPLATPSSGQSRVNKTMEGVQNYPAIAMEPDGDYVVVWQGKGVGDQHGVFARQYDTAGDSAVPLATELRTATGERISEGESLFNNPATLTVVFNEEMSTSGGATGYHSVENPNNWALVDGQGNEQVSAISEIEFSLNPATNKWEAVLTFNSALYPNGLENGYYTLVARSQLQDLAGNALAMTGLQTSGTGLSYVPATSPTGGMGFSFRVHELTPGDPNSGDLDPIVNTTEYTDAIDSAVARNADGQYVVVWVEEVGTETVDPTDSTSTVITYSTEIYARMFDANDEPISNRLGSDDAFLVNSLTTGDQVTPDVAIDDEGNFVVVWAGVGISGLGEQDDAGIFGQLFNANGDSVGGQFGINQTDDGIQSTPAVAMDDDGNFVVTWESHEQGGIMARKFDVSGASTDEFLVNSTTGNSHKTPDVAIDNQGEFAITWAADQQDSGSFGVFAQRYSADAAKVGDEFQVNQFETNQQEKPRIAMSDDGAFVITWQSFGQDAFGGYGVYARCYDTDGNAASSEFQVNDYTASYQFEPAVAMDSNGDFVITWSSYGQEGDGGEQYGIFAKMYNADGSLFVVPGQTDPLGEFRINAIADGGGNDYARIFDTSSVDKFVGTPTMSRMYSTQADYDVSAELFDLTLAKSVNGGNDIARFFDSDDKEIFLGTADKAEFSGDDFEIIARKFEKVEATATPGTGDIAKLRDTEGDDHLVADADSARLYSKDGDEIELLYEVFAFDQVKTYRSEGNDTKDVADVVDYLLLDDGWLDDY